MRVIGFRCSPKSFSFVVLEGTQQKPIVVAHDSFAFPKNRSWGVKLSWLRKQIVEILQTYKIEAAGLKRAETSARRPSSERSEVEGVVKETVRSIIDRECVARLKSQLRRDIAGFNQPARYLTKVLETRDLDGLNTAVYQEATLAAIAELPEEG